MDIFDLPVPENARWRVPCGGYQGDDGDACIRSAPIGPDVFALQSTKRPEAGTVRATRAEINAFVADWLAQQQG